MPLLRGSEKVLGNELALIETVDELARAASNLGELELVLECRHLALQHGLKSKGIGVMAVI